VPNQRAGFFALVAGGFTPPSRRYYLTNLWNAARAGDVKLRWELPIELPREQSYRLTLNNANALPLP
jgi:hypothetical protein